MTLQEATDIIARWTQNGVPVALAYILPGGAGHVRINPCRVEIEGPDLWALPHSGNTAQACVSLQGCTFSYQEGAELQAGLLRGGYAQHADAVWPAGAYLTATNPETGARLCLVELPQ